MKHLPIIVAVALAMLAVAGCSKPAPDETLPPLKAPAAKAIEFPPPTNLPAPQVVKAAPVAPVEAPAVPQEDSPETLVGQVKQFEADYQNATDFQKKVVIIYNLSSVESPETIDAIGRLFLNEKDKELKIELVNSLLDIDGENDKKLAILGAAIRGDQPKDVRLQGIDGMGDTEDKRSIQVLQGLLTDPDEDIRENAQDTIDQLQTDVAPAQPNTQPQFPAAK
jgi:hypothetical protein